MAGSVVATVVIDWFAESAIAEAIGSFVAVGLSEAGVAAGTSLLASSLVVGAAGLAAGAVAGGLVSEAVGSGSAASVSAARAQGLLINSSSTVEALPVIYGTRKVGGTRCLCEVSGDKNEYLHIVLALCEGEIDAVSQIYLDDIGITQDRFKDLVYSETYLGTDTQTASAALIAALPDKWTTQHIGGGVAYVYVRLLYNRSAFNGLPTITCDVRGKKVYDPRTALTAWSYNPALCIRDYLTNTRYGRGIAAALVPDVYIAPEADFCDALVTVPRGLQVRYSCDGVVNINNTVFNNTKSLLSCCRAMLVYSAGLYKLVIDKQTTPGFAFTEDNITGSWTIAQPGRRVKFNRVTAGIFNPANNWQPDFAISDSPAYRSLDNNRLSECPLDLPYTADMYRGQQLAGLTLKQSRFGINVRFNALQEGLRAEVGDVVSITHTTPGWTAKPFRVIQMVLTPDDEVEVTCIEYDDSVYNLDTLTAITGAPASNLPDVFTLAAAGAPVVSESLYTTSGSVGVRTLCTVSCAALQNAFVVAYLFEYKLASSSVWMALPDALSPVALAYDLAPGSYQFRVRVENTIGARSAYSPTTNKEMYGLTAAPANLTGFSIIAIAGRAYAAWDLSLDLDVRIGGRISIRHTPLVSGAVWENGIVLDEFNGDAVNATLPLLTGTYMLKARDSSDNYSAAMVSFVATESQVTGFTTVATSTQSPGFAGVKSGTAVDGATLKLDGTTLIDSMATNVDAWGYIDTLGGVATLGSYYFDAAMNFGAVLTRRLNATVQALSIDSGDTVDVRGLMDDLSAIDGGVVNDCDANLYYRSTQTDPAGAPVWSAWTPFMTADVTCWGLQFRLDLVSASPTHNILISTLTVVARSSP